MDNDYIKIEDLKDGYLYRIHARNGNYGIWNESTKGFMLSRVKFGDNYLFEEHHWDCAAFPTARPLEEIEKCPFEERYGQNALDYLNKFENR